MLSYLEVRPSTHGPMFVFEDGIFLSRQKLVGALNRSLVAAGIDPDFYKGHSFSDRSGYNSRSNGCPGQSYSEAGQMDE